MGGKTWHILTGEYPPQPGGVSDYTARLAEGLAAKGADVRVWTGQTAAGPALEAAGVNLKGIAGLWSQQGLRQLAEELRSWPAPRRLLVQYTPNAWGRKGLNFTFCKWLLERSKAGDEIHLMVHEPFYPYQLWDKPTRWLLAAGQRRMMRLLLAASSKVYVAIPAWADLLRPFDGEKSREMIWLPICSTIPVYEQPAQVETLHQWFAPGGEFIVGSFGGFGGGVGALTEELFASLLAARNDIIGLFLGAGSEQMAERLRRSFPPLASRLRSSGALPAIDVSCHLLACDVLLQAYPDGVSTRRTSTIAGMAHGRPIVTVEGALTEPFWRESGGARLAGLGDVEGGVREVLSLLDDEAARLALGAKARAVYDAHLAVENTVQRLLAG